MAFKSICGRLAACVVVGVLPLGASAQQTPNTDQIYQMILQQQQRLQKLEADQGVLKSKAAAAEAQAAQARQALMRTKQELQTTRQALEETRQAVRQPRPQGDAARMAARGAGARFETGFRVNAEGRYVHGSHFAGTAVGLPAGTASLIHDRSVDMQETDFDGGGVRAGLGYTSAGGWDFGATYTGIVVSGRNKIGQQGVDLDNVVVNGLDLNLVDRANIGSNSFQNGIVDFASQDINLRHHILDLDVGRHVALTDDLQAVLFTGVRVANLSLDSDTTYRNVEGNVGLVDHVDIQRQLTMLGAGLRFGSRFSYGFGDSGFSVFAIPEASLLYVNSEVTRDEIAFNATTNLDAAQAIRADKNSLVPVLDATVGFGYAKGRYDVRAGYQFSNWFDAVKTFEPRATDDIFDGNAIFELVDRDLTYGGFFLRGSAQF